MPKLLAEFLQEQQEPFALEVYLVERGYQKRLTLQSSAKYTVSPNCSYFLRAVFKQLVMASDDEGQRKVLMAKPKTRLKNEGGEGLSSKSDDASHFSEAAITRFVKWGKCFLERGVEEESKMRGEEECKHLSPVSVLGEIKSDEDSPSRYEECNFKSREESSTSSSRCRLKQPRHCRFRQSRELNPCDQYVINKRALGLTKQLRIDCIQEVRDECRKKEENGIEVKSMFGDGEIWKYICEKLWIWSQDSITEYNIIHLLHSNFLGSAHEWNASFEQMKIEICKEIENAILEIVIDDIMAGM